MQAIEATITGQGQVTIPAEVRRHLGLSKGERIAFVIDETGVRLVRPQYTFETACGAVPALPGTSADFDREIEEAMEDEADRIVGRRSRP
jgi:AbrB family looped-hinge helix DNA binding protein